MSFGKNLETTKIDSKLYHKTTLENLQAILQEDFSDRGLCCSTEESDRLFPGREVVVVFSKKEREGMYDFCDADAGRDYGYDEFRLESFSADEIEQIICDADTYALLEACADGFDEGDEVAKKIAELLPETVDYFASIWWDNYSKIEEGSSDFLNF